MKPILKITFVDFYPQFELEDLFSKILSKHYTLVYTIDNPDLAICTIFGNERHQFKAKKKILWVGENHRVTELNSNNIDAAISFDHNPDINKPHLRFPLWKYYMQLKNTSEFILDKTNRTRDKFCCFIASNPNAPVRNSFFQELSKYKQIDSFGKVYNNRHDILRKTQEDNLTWQVTKINYLRTQGYKFIITYENSLHSGYTTEKLFDGMASNILPIYWGDPDVSIDFNSNSIIDAHKFNSTHNLIEYIKELDNNEDLYNKIYNEPWLTEPQKEKFLNNELEEFLLKIINS